MASSPPNARSTVRAICKCDRIAFANSVLHIDLPDRVDLSLLTTSTCGHYHYTPELWRTRAIRSLICRLVFERHSSTQRTPPVSEFEVECRSMLFHFSWSARLDSADASSHKCWSEAGEHVRTEEGAHRSRRRRASRRRAPSRCSREWRCCRAAATGRPAA